MCIYNTVLRHSIVGQHTKLYCAYITCHTSRHCAMSPSHNALMPFCQAPDAFFAKKHRWAYQALQESFFPHHKLFGYHPFSHDDHETCKARTPAVQQKLGQLHPTCPPHAKHRWKISPSSIPCNFFSILNYISGNSPGLKFLQLLMKSTNRPPVPS